MAARSCGSWLGNPFKGPVQLASEVPLESKLNERGKDGWELVSVSHDDQYGYVYYFKRPQAEKAPTLPPIRN
jgi:hypothetical protein